MDTTHPHEHDRPEPWWRSPRGRVSLAVVVLAAVLGVLKFTAQSPAEMTCLAVPSPLSQDSGEVRRRLQQAGVTQFEYANGQVHVPADVAETVAAILHADSANDQNWADEWEAANAKLGHFSGTRERETAREIARARQISRMLNQMPGITHADVVWDDEKTGHWNGVGKSRATVYLKPKTGSEITPEIIRSVRAAVAGSKAHLAAEDVIVMDLDRRITYEATLDEPLLRQQDQQRDERAAIYRRRIEQLLQHVDGVRVGVFIDDVPFPTSVEHPWADPLTTPLGSTLPPAMPIAVTLGSEDRDENGHPSHSKSASTLLGINQETAELVHVHLAVPEEFYLRRMEMIAETEAVTFDQTEREVNEHLHKRVRDALPDSGPTPEVVVDLIPGERITSAPVAAVPGHWDAMNDPTVIYPLGGIGLVVFAIGWAVVAARRGWDEDTEWSEDTENHREAAPSISPPQELHGNPLEFLATTRFADWLPALLMEPMESLAKIVSVLPSPLVGELMSHLPVPEQVELLQRAARQTPPTEAELEGLAARLRQEQELPHFSQSSPPRGGASPHAVRTTSVTESARV